MSVDFQYVDVYVIHDRHHHHRRRHHHHRHRRHHHHHHHHPLWRYVDAIIRFSMFVKGGGGSPMKTKLISFLMQHICQRGFWICWPLTKISWCDSSFNIFVGGGVWFLAPYEDKLMLFLIQHSCQRGVAGCWSLMQISRCDYTIQHICQRGWWIFDPLWRQLDVIAPFNIFARGGGCLIPYEDKLMWLHKSTHLS